MALIKRDGNIIWDNKNKERPGIIFHNYLNSYDYSKEINNDPIISLNNSKKEISKLDEKYIYSFIPNFIENTSKSK